MRHWLLAGLLVLAAIGGWSWFQHRPITRSDSVLAPDDPVQTDIDDAPLTVPFKDATLHPLAKFSLTARVLSRDDYRFDAGSTLSPTDLGPVRR